MMEWYCPACGLTARTRPVPNRFHQCPKMAGLTTPLVRKGIAAKLERRDREDYVGSEKVQTDDMGRPAMSIVTIRDDGQDVTVFAPTATGRGEA